MSNRQPPLVSVIIPIFNSAKFIPQTLESLLCQTMTDFEVVVVDYCSADNSVEVVENFYARFGGRLHVIKLPKSSITKPKSVKKFFHENARCKLRLQRSDKNHGRDKIFRRTTPHLPRSCFTQSISNAFR